MPAWITAAIQWLGKFTPRYAAVIAMLSGALLFVSDKTLKYFDLDALAKSYRGTIALVFAASLFLLVTYPLSAAGTWVGHRIGSLRLRRAVKRNCENLAADHVALLLQFVRSGNNTILVPYNNMVVAQDLISKGILERHQQIANAMNGIGYSITREAAPYVRSKTFQKMLLKSAAGE